MTPMSNSDARKRLRESVERLETRTYSIDPPRFDGLRDYLQRLDRERAEREFRANPPAWTRHAFRTRALWIDPPRFTVPAHVFTQEDAMTDQPEPYDFHDEAERALLNDNLAPGEQASLHALLAIHDTLRSSLDRISDEQAEQTATLHALRDRLPEPTWQHECTDVTEEPHKVHDHGIDPTCREHVGSDGLLRGECIDTAPDVDPDEALADLIGKTLWPDDPEWSHRGTEARQRLRETARAAREHIYAEPDQSWVTRDIEEAEGYYRVERARAEKAEADVLRLTRERDVAEARCERLSVLAEKGERYEALRDDIVRYQDSAFSTAGERAMAGWLAARDDERAKGEQR